MNRKKTPEFKMDLSEICIQAAIEAGKAIIEVYNSDDFGIETKGDNSPLTKADKRANDIIINYLNKTAIPVLSEEEKDIPYTERSKWDKFWLVDPLDGTKEFIKRNGEFTVNIALIDNNVPVMGVVYVPVSGELYFGQQGKGAVKYENAAAGIAKSKAISLPVHEKREKYTVVASRSHLSDDTQKFIHDLEKKHGKLDFISKGSSLKICMIAEGRADIYPRLGPTMEWDTAAGNAVILGMGGRIIRYDNNLDLTYNKKELLNPYFIVYPNKTD